MRISDVNVFFGISNNISLKRISLHSKIYKIVICLLAFFGMPFLQGCGQTQEQPGLPDESSYIFTMGTAFQIRAIGNEAADAVSSAGKVITECDRQISWREKGSICEAFNETGEVSLDDRMVLLISDMLEICESSGGAFDPTILPVSVLWGFDRLGEEDFDSEDMTVPDQESIANALELVDYHNLSLDRDQKKLYALSDGLMMELGAIGKGFALDEALSEISGMDIKGCMINAGSSIAVSGTKDDGSLFRIAIRDPRGSESDHIGVLTATDCCVSTSGDYERYFEKDGIRYHHILDPATGCPAESGLMQATVITENGAVGDALSTACFILGLDEGMKLAKAYDAKAVFVDMDRNVWYNDPSLTEMIDFSGEAAGYSFKEYEP